MFDDWEGFGRVLNIFCSWIRWRIVRNNPRTNVQKIVLFVICERELEVEEDE